MNRDRARLPVLDPEPLRRLHALGGDHLAGQIVQAFSELVDEKLAEIDQALARGDMMAIRRVAHALRSSAGNVGACAVAALTRRIEALGGTEPHRGDDAHGGDDENHELLARLIGELRGACAAARTRLLEIMQFDDGLERPRAILGR